MTEEFYEKRDAKGGRVLFYTIIGMVILIIIIVMSNEFFIYEKEKLIHKIDLSEKSILLREVRARQTEKLNSFVLLDSAKGIAKIPIETAMQLMVDKYYLEHFSRER